MSIAEIALIVFGFAGQLLFFLCVSLFSGCSLKSIKRVLSLYLSGISAL